MPLERSKLSKDHQKLVAFVKKMEIPSDRFNPEGEEQRPAYAEQIEKLASWNIETPRSAKAAQSMIDFVEGALNMAGDYEALSEERKHELVNFQKIYPRGTIVRAKYYKDDIEYIDYGQVIDWHARTLEEKIQTRESLRMRHGISPRKPLAPFQLVVLVRGGTIARVSLSNIRKIKEVANDVTGGSSPEGTRRLR